MLLYLLEGEKTVSEFSERFDIIEPGVRKHLDHMERIGIVSSFFAQNGPGRPKKYYKITTAGRSLFPKMYDHLLNLVLSNLSRRRTSDGEIESHSILREVASNMADSFNSRTDGFSFAEKVSAFEDFLNELGFSCKSKVLNDGTVSIVRNDCAVYNLALKNYPMVCEQFDTVLVSKCLGEAQNVKLNRCMALGAKNCEHIVTGKTSSR